MSVKLSHIPVFDRGHEVGELLSALPFPDAG